MPAVQFGVDRLVDGGAASLKGLRVGLVTNDAAVTAVHPRPLIPVRVALLAAGVHLVRLFSPEHGLAAAARDGESVPEGFDAMTRLPVESLYGATCRPTARSLEDLDLLLVDLPDIGARFYTYIWTLSHAMEACAEAGKPLHVLDRPNPLGGDLSCAEGPILGPEIPQSLIGRWPIPVRHSLTLGELARLWNAEQRLGVDLTVTRAEGWTRSVRWPELGLPFVPASPAMPSWDTALIYPGTCLLESLAISEGRGTAVPFRVAGAPWINAVPLTCAFNRIELPGVLARPTRFRPASGQYRDQECAGIMLHATDEEAFRPVAAGLHLISLIWKLHPGACSWAGAPAANPTGADHFDRLIGARDIRRHVEAPGSDFAARVASWTMAPGWSERAGPHLLY